MTLATRSICGLRVLVAIATLGCGSSEPTAPRGSHILLGARDSTFSIGRTIDVSANLIEDSGVVVRGPISWRSSDPSVLAVVDSAHVLGVADGTATLTATISGVSASFSLRVTGVRSISTGIGGQCAVRSDGKIYCWGGPGVAYAVGNQFEVPTEVNSTVPFVSVSVGPTGACAVAESRRCVLLGPSTGWHRRVLDRIRYAGPRGRTFTSFSRSRQATCLRAD